uniref:Uncharacterized protein n=1 Tax=Labrus bergylta TaxID=56723 RepID=A0A3Q3M441_9LABR
MNVSEENLLKSISNDALLDLTQRYGQSAFGFGAGHGAGSPAGSLQRERREHTSDDEDGFDSLESRKRGSPFGDDKPGASCKKSKEQGGDARLNDALDGLRSPLLLAKNYILMQAQALEDEAAGGVSEPGTDHNLTHPHRLAPFGQAAVYPFSGSALATCAEKSAAVRGRLCDVCKHLCLLSAG